MDKVDFSPVTEPLKKISTLMKPHIATLVNYSLWILFYNLLGFEKTLIYLLIGISLKIK